MPFTALADGSKVYVSSQRDGGVFCVSLSKTAAPQTAFIPTGDQTDIVGGSHPVSLLRQRLASCMSPMPRMTA